jgi:hypothetical protein
MGVRASLKFQHPSTPNEVQRQPLFWNGEILNNENQMLGDALYAFGCLWARKGIGTIGDLWDTNRNSWKRTNILSQQVGRKIQPDRYEEVLVSIPSTWCIRSNPTFIQFEWVASTLANRVERLYQIISPMQGYTFKEVQTNLFAPCSQELVDLTGLELTRVRVVATSGNLKASKLNPGEEYLNPVWLIGLTHTLSFDLGEWKWISAGGEVPFFSYTSQIGYQAGLSDKCQDNRLLEKCCASNMSKTETNTAIDLI